MDTPSITELEQHATALRERVMSVAAEIKALLAEDLPRFVERELKRAFVSKPEFAAAMSEDQLRTLKKAIADRSAARTEEVLAALQLESLWFPAHSGADDDRKSVSENAPLWSAVNAICDTVNELRAEYGFPESDEPVEYRPPTWFIGRRYLPSLSEKYWRHVRELAEAQGQIGEINREVSRVDLTKRWDGVD